MAFVTLRGFRAKPATRQCEKRRSLLPSSNVLTTTAFFPACRPAKRITTFPVSVIISKKKEGIRLSLLPIHTVLLYWSDTSYTTSNRNNSWLISWQSNAMTQPSYSRCTIESFIKKDNSLMIAMVVAIIICMYVCMDERTNETDARLFEKPFRCDPRSLRFALVFASARGKSKEKRGKSEYSYT